MHGEHLIVMAEDEILAGHPLSIAQLIFQRQAITTQENEQHHPVGTVKGNDIERKQSIGMRQVVEKSIHRFYVETVFVIELKFPTFL